MMLSPPDKNILLITCILVLVFLFDGCRNRAADQNAIEVDSMLNIVYTIQDTISSENVMVLHEIRQSLNDDLSLVYDSMYEGIINSPVTTQYASLYTEVESCVMACNNYHEEIFLLESELQELLERINSQDVPDDTLDRKIQYESDLLKDMQLRVDTNLNKIARHIVSFYTLKPQMDSLFILSGVEIQAP